MRQPTPHDERCTMIAVINEHLVGEGFTTGITHGGTGINVGIDKSAGSTFLVWIDEDIIQVGDSDSRWNLFEIDLAAPDAFDQLTKVLRDHGCGQ